MLVRDLVRVFYEKFWNEVDLEKADEILHPDVTFRGSVGLGARGRREVCDYVPMVTTALSGYRCDVESLIADGDSAAAKVRFSGIHTGDFLGHPPTGRRVEWIGAAFFTADESKLRDIWVLGDLESLRSQLRSGS
ncbi:MAG: ester cyclase [Actinobacteria bacterium]|nr:ester cyclase [Actinomycetota bacterium]